MTDATNGVPGVHIAACRLLFRGEGEFVNAYFAGADDDDEWLLMGSIRTSIVTHHPELFEQFRTLMTTTLDTMLRSTFGDAVADTAQYTHDADVHTEPEH